MKAIRIHQLGKLNDLVLEDVAPPTIAPGHVLLRNQACSVNPIDWKTCSGGGAAPHIADLPFIPGWECAGEVIAVADDIKDFKVGDQVMGLLSFPKQAGCLAEQVLANADHICHRPDNLPAYIGATLGIAGLTAWQALFDKGDLLSGQRLLVLGGAGGVGHLAVQIGRVHGAKVFTTASPKNHPTLSKMGASCIDYHSEKLLDALTEPVDLVIDCVGGSAAKAALPILKKDGVMVTLPSVTKQEVIDAGEACGRTVLPILVEPNPEQLARLGELVDEGDVDVLIAERFPLSQTQQAFEANQTGRVIGKIVIDI